MLSMDHAHCRNEDCRVGAEPLESGRKIAENCRLAPGCIAANHYAERDPIVPTVQKSALVFYSSSAMYALVSDIESYPQFLPWCRSTEILSRDGEMLQARIEMLKGGVHKSFTTRNWLRRDEMIEMHLLQGPFLRLDGFWRFHALRSDACKVSLEMSFEFSNNMLRLAIEPVFTQIGNSLVDSFCKRAVELYGRPKNITRGSRLRKT
jgi:ribosome-associated toxin RatA of RatAB toxin-antitoxin module